jgi:large subunit ribosomal protein L3
MVKRSKPRAGALAFYPRVRAKRIYPHITRYPAIEKVKPLAFAAYKAGMVTVIALDNVKTSPTFGQEIAIPATVLDCPPLLAVAIRAYKSTPKGLRVFKEVWAKELPKDLERRVKVVKRKTEERLAQIEAKLEEVSDIRLVVATQPRLSGIGKKRPEVFEVGIGGKAVKKKFEFAKGLLGKTIEVSDVFREGELVDVIAITRGKGVAGPVKRFGVKIQVRKAKKKRRHVGTLGQERPGKVRWTVPMAGQLGFQRRTEFNKRILRIGEKGEEVTPKGGFVRYGVIRGPYMLLKGSTPGPKRRLIMLRYALRPGKLKFVVPEVREVVS